MTDTTISDAVAWPEDDGTGVPDDSEDYNSAGYFGLLARMAGENGYVANGLTFDDVVTTDGSESVNIGAGHAYVLEAGNTVQSGTQRSYDTTLPSGSDMVYLVVLPTQTADLALAQDATNDVWLAHDPTTNDDVYIRHGSGLSAPSDPSVKLGTIDTTDGSTTRANDAIDFNSQDLTGVASIDGHTVTGDLGLQGDIDLEGRGADTVITLDDTFDLIVEDDGGTNLFAIRESGGVDVLGGNSLTVQGGFPFIIIDETGTGDSALRFKDDGTAKWDIGHDASVTDGDLFVKDRKNGTVQMDWRIGTEVRVLNVPFRLPDITSPSAPSGGAYIYTDSADGDLKVTFANGNEFTLQTNT